jgi:hypothetical protein
MNWFNPLRSKNAVKPSLENYVSTERMDGMLAADIGVMHEKDLRALEFVWLWIKNGHEHEDQLTAAIDLCSEFGATIETIFPPVVICWFGVFPHFKMPDQARFRLVTELSRRFQSGAKVIHGKTMARVGNYGSRTRFTHGSIAVNQSDLLDEFFRLEFGEYKEQLDKAE